MDKAKECVNAGDQYGAMAYAIAAAQLNSGGDEAALWTLMDNAKDQA